MNVFLIVLASVVAYVAMMFVAGWVARALRRRDFVLPRELPGSIIGEHDAVTAIRVFCVLWPVGALLLLILLSWEFVVFLSACAAGSAVNVEVEGPTVPRGYDRGVFGKNDGGAS